MRAPEWELSALIAAPLGTVVRVGEVAWRKVRRPSGPVWVSVATGEQLLSRGLLWVIEQKRARDGEESSAD